MGKETKPKKPVRKKKAISPGSSAPPVMLGDGKVVEQLIRQPEPEWKPICRITGVLEYNQERGVYEESMTTVEFQQESVSKKIRVVKIG